MQRHAEAVATKNHVHVLYVTFLKDLPEKIRIEQETIHGVVTTIVYCQKGISGWLTKRSAFQSGIKFLQQKGQFQFDLVHLNIIWNAGWQARWLKSKFDLPYIITEHWTGYDKSIRKDQPLLLRPFSRHVVAKSSMICPVTENLATVMRNYGLQGNYTVVPNVVDTSIFHLHEKDNTPIRFLHVSTLDDVHKNISGILRTWKKFSDENAEVHLSIGGDGPFQFYEKKAEELEIRPESISFFGEKKWNEIAALMQQSHCLLMFSNYENLPCVIVEAMASGMAVISTDVGGIKEHVDSSRGILVTKGNENELLTSLQNFRMKATSFDTASLRKYAEDHFSVNNVATAFDSIYRKVLSK